MYKYTLILTECTENYRNCSINEKTSKKIRVLSSTSVKYMKRTMLLENIVSDYLKADTFCIKIRSLIIIDYNKYY